MTASETDLKGPIDKQDEQIDKKRLKIARTPKITYVRCSQTHRLSTSEFHFCSRTTTFFGSFRILFTAQSF